MLLQPYMRVESDHVCAEVLNNCRVLAYLSNSYNRNLHPVWRNADLSGCGCCHVMDDADYTFPGDTPNNPAPWFDPSNPASGEAFGFLVDLDGFNLESGNTSRLSGGRGGRQEITITGSVVASSTRGNNYFVRWLLSTLNNCCSSCSGLAVEMFESCAAAAEVCSPGESLTIGQQDIPVTVPYTVCYTPFAFTPTDTPTLFSNVCPAALSWVEGGSNFSAYNLPSVAQMAAATTLFGTTGCDVEVRGRDGNLIPGERDLFRMPIDGVAGPVDGEMTVKFEVTQEHGNMGFGLYDTVADSWVPLTNVIGQGSGTNRGSHLQIVDGTDSAIGTWLLYFAADGFELGDLELVMFSLGQNEMNPALQELLTGFRFTWNGVATVPSVEHGGGCGGWIINGINVDPDPALSTWTTVEELRTWMNLNDPNGVTWLLTAGDQLCSSVDLAPGIAGQYGIVSGCSGELMPPETDGERFDPSPDPIFLVDANPLLDLGRRSLTSMRFVAMDEIFDTDDFGQCAGRRYALTFDTSDHGVTFGDPVQVCQIDTWKAEWIEPSRMRTPASSALSCTNCGIPCRCSTVQPDVVEVVEPNCFVQASQCIRAACLTEAIPEGIWAPIVKLRNPEGELWVDNLQLRIVRALHGAPSILNQTQGALWYQNQGSVAEANIVGIAPGSTLTLDGRVSRPRVTCFNGDEVSGAGIVFGASGRSFRMPTLGCGTYWLEVCLSGAVRADGSREWGELDLDVEFSLAPVYEVV